MDENPSIYLNKDTLQHVVGYLDLSEIESLRTAVGDQPWNLDEYLDSKYWKRRSLKLLGITTTFRDPKQADGSQNINWKQVYTELNEIDLEYKYASSKMLLILLDYRLPTAAIVEWFPIFQDSAEDYLTETLDIVYYQRYDLVLPLLDKAASVKYQEHQLADDFILRLMGSRCSLDLLVRVFTRLVDSKADSKDPGKLDDVSGYARQLNGYELLDNQTQLERLVMLEHFFPGSGKENFVSAIEKDNLWQLGYYVQLYPREVESATKTYLLHRPGSYVPVKLSKLVVPTLNNDEFRELVQGEMRQSHNSTVSFKFYDALLNDSRIKKGDLITLLKHGLSQESRPKMETILQTLEIDPAIFLHPSLVVELTVDDLIYLAQYVFKYSADPKSNFLAALNRLSDSLIHKYVNPTMTKAMLDVLSHQKRQEFLNKQRLAPQVYEHNINQFRYTRPQVFIDRVLHRQLLADNNLFLLASLLHYSNLETILKSPYQTYTKKNSKERERLRADLQKLVSKPVSQYLKSAHQPT